MKYGFSVLKMEHKVMNDPLENNATSLQGLYTDFDTWVIKYISFYKRSIRTTESEEPNQDNISVQINSTDVADNIILDVFAANILFKQRHTCRRPTMNVNKDEEIIFYDYNVFNLMDNNSHRNIICRLVRSKL